MGRVKTIWEPCVFQARPSGPLKKVANRDICLFHRKRLEPRVLPWQQHRRCHSASFVMYIAGAKFEEHCLNISRVVLDWMFCYFSGTTYDVITFLICIIQKLEYLQNEKRYAKKENAILLYSEKPFKPAAIIFYFMGTLRPVYTGEFCWGNSMQFCRAKIASSFKHVRNPCDIAGTNRSKNRTWFTRAILKLQLWARQKSHRVAATKIACVNGPLQRSKNWTSKSTILKEMLQKSSQFLSSDRPREPKSLDVALNIAKVEKYARKTCDCGQPGGHSIRVLSGKES